MMMNRARKGTAALAILAATVLSVTRPGAAANITVKGSDTMVILGQRWAEEFMKANQDVTIQVTGGGSGTGIAALINGTTEIATASRPMKDAERQQVRARAGADPTEIAVAKDGVAFYVHPSNGVTSLTVDQLKQIYLGDIENWKEVGGKDARIVVYSRENNSGTYVFVKEHLLGGEDFTPRAQTLPGTAAAVNAIGKEPNAIGYGGGAYAKGVKELKVNGVEPSMDNVKKGKYPLSRDLFFYTRGKPQADARAFIDFALSAAGQEIVTKVGYFPVK
jgi:phosphate transport system substrate-binding protein